MKQEYHYTISRTDRLWLIVFVLFLLSWELVKYVLPGSDVDVLDQGTFEKTDSLVAADNREPKNITTATSEILETEDQNKYVSDQDEIIMPFLLQEATFSDLRSAG